MPKKSFRSKLHQLRPDVASEIKGNETKRKLALALRALRKEAGFTQKDIEHRSSLSQPVISRLESPTGSLPNWDTVTRYVAACKGHMLVGFSTKVFDEKAFVSSKMCGADNIVAAVAAV